MRGFSSCPCCLLSGSPWGSHLIFLLRKISDSFIFALEQRGSCRQLHSCVPSPPLLPAGHPASSHGGSGVRVLDSAYGTEKVISHHHSYSAVPLLLQCSPSQHFLFSPIPPEPPRDREEEKGKLSPLPTVKSKHVVASLLLTRCGIKITQSDVS